MREWPSRIGNRIYFHRSESPIIDRRALAESDPELWDSQNTYEGPHAKPGIWEHFNWAFLFALLFTGCIWILGILFVIFCKYHGPEIYRWCQTLMGMVAQ